MFPRRHRSLVYKLLVGIPALWLLAFMFFYTDTKKVGEIPTDIQEKAAVAAPLVQSAEDVGNSAQGEESKGGNPVDEGVLIPPHDPNGPGELGKPVKIEKPDVESKRKIDKGWKDNAFNQYVSDMISVHRSLPDPRDNWCKASGRFLSDLPKTSVVVCFHNEAWSVLLRTVHSILNRSPKHLIDEIILVDDASTMDHLKEQLDSFAEQYPQVKVVRAPERVGLIRARLMGAKYVKAPVVTFLDSHCIKNCID